MSSLRDTDVLDLLVQDEDLEELLMSSSCPFVFHSGMNCPVVSCGFASFTTRKSYSRHWETKHKPSHVIFYCSIPGCKSTCKRKTDMRYHLRSIHKLIQLSLENQLQLCKHEIQPNNNYIDPGSLKFVSRLPCDESAQLSISTLEPAPLPTPEISSLMSNSSCQTSTTLITSTADSSFIPSTIISSFSVIPLLQPSSFTSSLLPSESTVVSSMEPSSIISSVALSPISAFTFGSSVVPSCPPVTDIATQTEDSVPSSSSSSFDSIPAEENNLEHFITNISVEIARLVKLKDVAIARLNERSELQHERELRRELERENRRLMSEIASMKRSESERENVYFSRDERLEMFESADGSLNCFKRNSTSLSKRLGQKVVLKPYQIFEE